MLLDSSLKYTYSCYHTRTYWLLYMCKKCIGVNRGWIRTKGMENYWVMKKAITGCRGLGRSEEFRPRSDEVRRNCPITPLSSCLAAEMLWLFTCARSCLCLVGGYTYLCWGKRIFVFAVVWPSGWINLIWTFTSCPWVFTLFVQNLTVGVVGRIHHDLQSNYSPNQWNRSRN